MTMSRRFRLVHLPRRGEAGFTLIELLVYMLLMVVVLTLVGGMLLNSSRTEKSVRGSAEAANLTQIIAQSIGRSVGSATAISISTATGGDLLVVRTAGGASTVAWSCEAWYYSVADGAMYTTRTTPASLIATPTTGSLLTWTKLGDGILRVGSSKVFTASATDPDTTVVLALQAKSGSSTPVVLDTTATRPKTTPAVISPCV